MKDPTLPLGQQTRYASKYRPDVLFAIPREQSRSTLGIATDGNELPFGGADVWNAWELTWLGPGNRPIVATAEIIIPAESSNLIESKSLKLYFNSFAMTPFSSPQLVRDTVTADLAACVGGPVTVRILPLAETEAGVTFRLPGTCLDAQAVTCSTWRVDTTLLRSDPATVVEEALYSHLLRSLCPVTAQPDIGSVAFHYRGPKIDPASLLQYIVSFRQHSDFHEACIERMFVDILRHCRPEKLSIQGRYQRRGGIDINPYRSNFEEGHHNLRLWRQ